MAIPRSHAEADRPLARRIGARLRTARLRAKLTQASLAEGRYTKAYISALENGLVKPSMAALNYLADKLEIPVTSLIAEPDVAWTRLEADLRLAAGDWQAAIDGYGALLGNSAKATRCELLRGLAEAAARLDRGEEAVRAGSEAAALFVEQGRLADAASARYWQAFGLYQLEQSDQARDVLRRVLDDIAGGLAVEPDLHIRVLIALGMVESRDDEPERALGYLEQARSLSGDLDDRRRATFLFSLALSYRELGDFEAAVSAGMQSLAHFRAVASDLEVGSIENELALVYLAIGHIDRARQHAAEAVETFARLDNIRLGAHAADTEAQIELAAGSAGSAAERSQDALRMADKSGNHKAGISAALTLARAYRHLGNHALAFATLEAAAERARRHARRAQLQTVLAEWAEVTAELGDIAGAYKLSQEALKAGRSPATAQSVRLRARGTSARCAKR